MMTSPSSSAAPSASPSSSSQSPIPSTSSASSTSKTLSLTPAAIGLFKTSRVFRTHIDPGRSYTSLSFDDKGEVLLTSAEDESLQLFNCRTGKHQKQLLSKKYGVHLARFTHKSSAAVYASTKEDDTVRYLNLHDNSFIRYFKGHKARVNAIDMSPADDTFLTGAADDSVRLWDLRTPTCQGYLSIAGHPTVTYDPTGSIFAVTLSVKNTVLMYDLRNFDKAPFLSVELQDPIIALSAYPIAPVYTKSQFSNDGKHLLVGTAGPMHYVLDAFSGAILYRLEGHTGLERLGAPVEGYGPRAGGSGEEVAWTPDGRFVISGSLDGKLHVWDVSPPLSDPAAHFRPSPGPNTTLGPVHTFEGHAGKPSRVVAFNPRYAMMASGGHELAFWLPDAKPS